ncbi:MAG: peptide chain release factor N(5)-glutamine methyltransferase [Hungatella sp.]|jgi:release factor glutamine methyltransferase|nr:peptide chain release factor N(5)-glutamine methyltransferase [Hungatella sp.]
MTLHQLLQEGASSLARAGDTEAQLDARRLLLEAFHLDMTHFLMNRMQVLEQTRDVGAAADRYREMIRKRSRRIPLQHILGSQDFMGLTFRVNEHVLIPRQDTETLVELVLEEHKDRNKKVLDLCTGSGCIAVSLSVLGGFEDVTATDLSFEALKVAKENAERLLDQGRAIRFLQGDLFDCLETRFDIITANPPYIATGVIRNLAPEVRDHEPRMALDGDEDGLCFYRRIAAKAGEWLEPGGCIYLEIGYDQGLAVSRLLEETGFENIRIVKDTPGLDRVVYAEGGRNV